MKQTKLFLNNKRGNKMKQIKFFIFILLSISILSCSSNEPIEHSPLPGYSFLERTSVPPNAVWLVAVASNGDVWAVNHVFGGIGIFDINHEADDVNVSIVYLSTDNGNTWIEKFSLPLVGRGSIAINPVNGYVFFTNNMWLYRSTDRGENWVRVANILPICDIAITASGEIYMGTEENIYYSTDNGDTWIEKGNIPFASYNHYSLTLGTDGTLYAGSGPAEPKGVYRSTDGGATWLPSSNYTDVQIRELTISDDGSIFAITSNNTRSGDVIKSTDRGNTWISVYDGSGAGTIIYNTITKDLFATFEVFYNYNVTIIYKSTDLGASWELEDSGGPSIFNFAFNHITGQMFAATSDGVYRSRGRW